MRETRIYDYGDGWLHKEELWHGGSEVTLLSSSIKKSDLLSPIRRWEQDTVIIGSPQKESWLAAELKRAKDNGHLK